MDAATLTGFAPNPARARFLDRRTRHELARSLRAVFKACGSALDVDRARLTAVLTAIRAAPVPPRVFGIYTALVEAVLADDLTAAQALADRLLSPATLRPTPRVVTLDDRQLGPGDAARYRHIIADMDVPIDVVAVDAAQRAESRGIVAEALRLLAHAAPALAAECDVLMRQIVLIACLPRPDGLAFDGATSFHLWGANFVNAARHPDRIGMAQLLAHESGHALLFGLTLGQQAVRNTAKQRYASPLRDDLRPMDGIVHACFVMARMSLCLRHLLDCDALTPAERARCTRDLTNMRAAFAATVPTVNRHARFTPEARPAFRQAEAWMRAA